MKKNSFVAVAVVLASGLAGVPAFADGQATKDEATAMVRKAVAHFKAVGPEKAFTDFSTKDGAFTDRDLYVVTYDLTGKCVAHGANAKLIGKDLIDAQDIDGKYYIQERLDLAKSKPAFWQDYKFSNPVTKKVEPKEMYCEVSGNYAICGGVYKK